MPKTLTKDFSKPQTRFLDMAAGSTVGLGEDEIEFPFSSEEPYDRWGEKEILSHEPGAMNLERLPVMVYLWNHNSEIVLGQVLKIWIEDRRGWCRIRWFDDPSIAKYRNLVESKTVKGVSFQYSVDKWKQISDDSYLVEKFTVFEVSSVSIPADHSVGIRSFTTEGLPLEIKSEEKQESPHKPSSELTEQEVRESIAALGKRFADIGGYEVSSRFLSSSKPMDVRLLLEANQEITELVFKKAQNAVGSPVNPLGLSEKEKKKYSLLKAMRSQLPIFQKEHGAWANQQNSLELEAHNALQKLHNVESKGVMVPFADLTYQRNTLNTQTGSQGGNLVDTTLSGDFIDLLRNESVLFGLGATMYDGLVGNLNFAKQDLAASFGWIAQGGVFPKSSMGFDLIGMNPKKLGGILGYTQEQLAQSAFSMEMMVRREMATGMMLALDTAAFWGTGQNNQPLGIFNRPIQSIALGTNGGSLTYGSLVRLKTKIKKANANRRGGLRWLTNASVEGTLQETPKQTSGVEGNFILAENADRMLGFPFTTSEQILSNLPKGNASNLSALLVGDFSSFMVGSWNYIEIVPNIYGDGFNQGVIEFRVHQLSDFQVRYNESFAAITDIITTV